MFTLYIVNVDYLDMVPIVQVSRDSTSILLCEYYHCISVDRSWHLCYSHVRPCIKGTLNLTLDILCCLCLRCAIGTYTGSHTLSTRNYLWILPVINTWQPVSTVVNPWASWLPQSAPRVNPCVYVNSTKVFPCARGGLVLSWGGPCVDTGGGGWLVLIIVVATSAHQRVNLRTK